VEWGFELRASHLEVLYHLSHTSSPFCFGSLEMVDGVCVAGAGGVSHELFA
jgi:hypothetical protein